MTTATAHITRVKRRFIRPQSANSSGFIVRSDGSATPAGQVNTWAGGEAVFFRRSGATPAATEPIGRGCAVRALDGGPRK
jgi:hypothetical protein